MSVFKVVEIFESINGEGARAGQLAVFVRFAFCNLNCSYCDTKWANEENAPYTLMTTDEIYNRIKETGIKNITLTGGEPLLREGIKELLEKIASDRFLSCEIETNGSIDLKQFCDIPNRPYFTMDYKLKSSGMEDKMLLSNFDVLEKNDVVKFVSSNREDLQKALYIIKKYDLTNRCRVYISPVFGSINLEEIVDFMKVNKLNNVNMQLQMHKIIWDPDKRGV